MSIAFFVVGALYMVTSTLYMLGNELGLGLIWLLGGLIWFGAASIAGSRN